MVWTMREKLMRGLPTMRGAASFWLPPRLVSAPRMRQLQRASNNVKVTLLCGFLTVLVLRGTIGAGNFGTPAQDFKEIKEHLQHVHMNHRKEPNRVLAEVKEKTDKSSEEGGAEEAEADSSKQYSLGPKISDWDYQREMWLKSHPESVRTVRSKPRTLLVTGSQPTACENPVGDHYLLKSIKNKIDYCRLHDIEIIYNMAHLDKEMTGF
eukprot:c47418_g1_i1 orf=199-825(+)